MQKRSKYVCVIQIVSGSMRAEREQGVYIHFEVAYIVDKNITLKVWKRRREFKLLFQWKSQPGSGVFSWIVSDCEEMQNEWISK